MGDELVAFGCYTAHDNAHAVATLVLLDDMDSRGSRALGHVCTAVWLVASTLVVGCGVPRVAEPRIVAAPDPLTAEQLLVSEAPLAPLRAIVWLPLIDGQTLDAFPAGGLRAGVDVIVARDAEAVEATASRWEGERVVHAMRCGSWSVVLRAWLEAPDEALATAAQTYFARARCVDDVPAAFARPLPTPDAVLVSRPDAQEVSWSHSGHDLQLDLSAASWRGCEGVDPVVLEISGITNVTVQPRGIVAMMTFGRACVGGYRTSASLRVLDTEMTRGQVVRLTMDTLRPAILSSNSEWLARTSATDLAHSDGGYETPVLEPRDSWFHTPDELRAATTDFEPLGGTGVELPRLPHQSLTNVAEVLPGVLSVSWDTESGRQPVITGWVVAYSAMGLDDMVGYAGRGAPMGQTRILSSQRPRSRRRSRSSAAATRR